VPATLADPWLSMRAGPVPVPIELHLPSLGVHAEVLGVGVTERGEMDAPQGGAGDPIWERAYWYRGSAIPGETSTALLAGHASAPQGGPAVFGRLAELGAGDPVTVHDTRTGLDLIFEVTEVALYGRAQAAEPANLARIYGTGPVTGAWSQPSADGLAHLTLITCAGTYRSADGTHDQRLVVYTQRVS
jgi:sortase A